MSENTLTSIPKKTRDAAGKALVAFLVLMGVLTIASNSLQEMSIAVVSVVNPQRGALIKQIDATGTLSAKETIPVFSEDAVRVAEVYVKTGASVSEGDPLFKLDLEALKEQYESDLTELEKAKNSREKSYSDNLKSKLDAVKSAKDTLATKQQDFDWAEADASTWELKNLGETEEKVAAAEAAYLEAQKNNDDEKAIEKAKDNYDTEKRKLDKLTNMRTYITKRDELEKAKLDLSAAQKEYRDMLTLAEATDGEVTAALKSIQLDLRNQDVDISEKETALAALEEKISKDGMVYAPVAGSVVDVSVEAGATASTTAASVSIGSASGGLSLTVNVSEDDAGEITVGDTADITVGGKAYQCRVVSVAPSASAQGMYEVGFELPGDSGVVGMNASMKFQKRSDNYDLLIPLGALRQDNDGYYVYIISTQDGALGAQVNAVRADIYIYDQDSTRVAVQSGISMRDQIISRGDRNINDGDRVRLDN